MRPQLRFKEFTDDWEEKKLGDVARKIKTKNKGLVSDNVLTISAQYGLISQSLFFSRNVASKDLSGYYLLSKNDFAYNKSYSKDYALGAIKRLSKYSQGIVSPLYICFTVNNLISNLFLDQYFESQKWNRYVNGVAQEGARNHGLLNIAVNDFFDMPISLPSLPEQEKIGKFFSLLDQRIEKQERKVALLEECKKGWMQKLFNQEIRFKGNYPDWEEKKLGDISQKIKAGGTPKTTIKEFYNGDIPFLTISDMTDNGKYIEKVNKSITKQGLISSSAWELPKNNLLLSMYASIGKVAKNLSAITFSQAIVGIILDNEGNKEYIYQYLNHLSLINYYDRYISEGTQKNLNIQKVKNIEILLPSLPEQEKIANFLLAQDELIEKEKEKLNLMKQEKQGFMQRMFV